MVSAEAAKKFQEAAFLSDLDAESRQALLGVLEEHQAEVGTRLLNQGDLNDRMFFLIEGTVTIIRVPEDGKIEHFLDLNAITAFGETSYFQRKPQLVSVEASTEIHYLVLERTAHERLRRENPVASEQLAYAAIRVLAGHFEIIEERVSELLHRGPNPRREMTEWDRFRAQLFGRSAR